MTHHRRYRRVLRERISSALALAVLVFIGAATAVMLGDGIGACVREHDDAPHSTTSTP